MGLLKFLFPSRHRIKALEDYLGVFYNSDWSEYEERKNNPLDNIQKRLNYIEKKKLTEKEREDAPSGNCNRFC